MQAVKYSKKSFVNFISDDKSSQTKFPKLFLNISFIFFLFVYLLYLGSVRAFGPDGTL